MSHHQERRLIQELMADMKLLMQIQVSQLPPEWHGTRAIMIEPAIMAIALAIKLHLRAEELLKNIRAQHTFARFFKSSSLCGCVWLSVCLVGWLAGWLVGWLAVAGCLLSACPCFWKARPDAHLDAEHADNIRASIKKEHLNLDEVHKDIKALKERSIGSDGNVTLEDAAKQCNGGVAEFDASLENKYRKLLAYAEATVQEWECHNCKQEPFFHDLMKQVALFQRGLDLHDAQDRLQAAGQPMLSGSSGGNSEETVPSDSNGDEMPFVPSSSGTFLGSAHLSRSNSPLQERLLEL